MPFTPAHPAIVLPFIKVNPRFLSATALIAGSISPDFDYFFRMSVNSEHGHSFAGIFYFDIPVACFLSIVFHLIVKKNLLDNLPPFFQRKFRTLRDFELMKYLKDQPWVFLYSVLLGVLSHILWDNFTHSDGFFVTELPFYHGKYVRFDGVKYPLWYWLQNVCTYVGLLAILIYVWRIKPVTDEIQAPTFLYWTAVVAVSTIVFLIRFMTEPTTREPANFVVTVISAACIAFIVAGFIPTSKKSHG